MKTTAFIIFFGMTSALFLSCEPKQENTPDAFQDKSIVNDISSVKRGYSDVITQLYFEILEKNKKLQALEDSLHNLRDETYTETDDANKYFSNNQKFYNTAYTQIELIQDSVLRENIFEKLSENETIFNKKTKKLTDLLAEISQKQAELNDYYTSLKILLTMKQNEEYQENNLPDTITVSNLKEKYEDLINLVKEKIKD